ncbi:MAG: hypothetical protein WDN28_26160 [Chthoniobacter sp.]
MRQNAMPARMPRQKINLPPPELAAHDDIRRRPERRLDGVFRDVGNPVDLVKAAASDDANGWCCHGGGIEEKKSGCRMRSVDGE